MHELSIAMGIVNRALETAEEHGAETVTALTVELGSATHVNPDQLKFCIETASKETPVAEAVVTIEEVTPLAECVCGWEGTPGTLDQAMVYAPDVTCPECGDRTTLIRGRECRLATVELPDKQSHQNSAQETPASTQNKPPEEKRLLHDNKS